MFAAPLTYPRRARPICLALCALAVLSVQSLTRSGMAEGLPDKPGELTETRPPVPVPDLTLTDLATEQPATLAAYRGRPVIVNLWATWCGPCVTEMPSLAKLAAGMKSEGIAVVAISEDRGGKFVVDPFLKEHDISGLPIYLDKTMSSGNALKGGSVLPMTVLIDADGEEIGRVIGDRDWDSPESREEILRLFGLKAPG